MPNIKDHQRYMNLAQRYSKMSIGYSYPNPSVGCVIVSYKDNSKGRVISYGYTGNNGRPHAEEIALKKAGKKSNGATMYVTLEPCNHKSQKNSCVQQIIDSGIKKIYIAKSDPDPRTNKKSIKKLLGKGMKVNLGLTSDNTYNNNTFFFQSIKNKRPFIKVKMAISNDQKIAWSNYKSKWISNSKSRDYGHKLRFYSQSIMTTSRTIIKDNPHFTVRKKNKILKYLTVIIIDRLLRTPIDSYLIKTLSKRRIIIFTYKSGKKFNKLKSLGCEIYQIKTSNINKKFNLSLICKKLFLLNISDILVESGGIFFTNLLSKKLVDQIHIFKAPFSIGNSGKPMIINKNFEDIKFIEISKKKFGKDVYQQFRKRNI